MCDLDWFFQTRSHIGLIHVKNRHIIDTMLNNHRDWQRTLGLISVAHAHFLERYSI